MTLRNSTLRTLKEIDPKDIYLIIAYLNGTGIIRKNEKSCDSFWGRKGAGEVVIRESAFKIYRYLKDELNPEVMLVPKSYTIEDAKRAGQKLIERAKRKENEQSNSSK